MNIPKQFIMHAIDWHPVLIGYVMPYHHNPTWHYTLPYLNRLKKCEP